MEESRSFVSTVVKILLSQGQSNKSSLRVVVYSVCWPLFDGEFGSHDLPPQVNNSGRAQPGVKRYTRAVSWPFLPRAYR